MHFERGSDDLKRSLNIRRYSEDEGVAIGHSTLRCLIDPKGSDVGPMPLCFSGFQAGVIHFLAHGLIQVFCPQFLECVARSTEAVGQAAS